MRGFLGLLVLLGFSTLGGYATSQEDADRKEAKERVGHLIKFLDGKVLISILQTSHSTTLQHACRRHDFHE
jgi:hypothetical protein